MMSERGVGLAHTTILRWVQHYTPEFEKRWRRLARTVGGSWRMDETDRKVRRKWMYLYRAVAELKKNGELPKRVLVRTSKYLNNAIEQDHRRVKQRLRPMLGLKNFRTAGVIAGIELAEKIKKKQFHMSKLGGLTATMPEIWQAALAA
jgi:transposase-like protein